MIVPVISELQSTNQRVSARNRDIFGIPGLFVVKFVAWPDAGQTSLILATLDRLPASIRPAVITTGLASSAERAAFSERRVPAAAFRAAGSDSYSQRSVGPTLHDLPLNNVDLLFVENAGDPFCPVSHTLGTDLSVVIAGVPEGHQTPARYPCMFANADAVVLNKADLFDRFTFDLYGFRRSIAVVNPHVALFVLSCRTGEGMEAWVAWLLEKWQAFFLGVPSHAAF